MKWKTAMSWNPINASRNLKSLNVTRNKLEHQIRKDKEAKHTAEADLVEHQKQLEIVLKQIDESKTEGPIVTEHAILRFLERFRGLDVSEIEQLVLALPQDCKVAQGNVIVTVLGENEREHQSA